MPMSRWTYSLSCTRFSTPRDTTTTSTEPTRNQQSSPPTRIGLVNLSRTHHICSHLLQVRAVQPDLISRRAFCIPSPTRQGRLNLESPMPFTLPLTYAPMDARLV